MRRVVALMAFVAMALAAAGCNFVTDEKYFKEGAGVDLYSSDAANQIDLQNQYIVYVCEQAGLATVGSTCGATFDPPTWALFVQSGMNDIDQRCDAYLTWLDAQRRNRAPVLAEIASIGGATTGIMTVAGAGPKAIGIAAAAFALASDSYAHWNSRLLLAVDHSTVQEIVYNRQQQFRITIGAPGFVVPDRAYAIYLLRNYLRICMPITIETEINTNSTLVQRGVPQAATIPVIRPIAPAVIRDVNAPLQRFIPRPPVVVETRIGTYEQKMSSKDLKIVLGILGCSGSDLGPVGSPARRTLTKLLADNKLQTSDHVTVGVFDDLRDLKLAGKQGTCSG